MSGSTNFGGYQGKPDFSQTAESDEAPCTRISMRPVPASETEGQQGLTWGQGDAVIRGGSVWQTGVEVMQVDRARSGVRREKGVPVEGHQTRRVRGEGMTESGGLVNLVNEIRETSVTVRDADEDASLGLRRSSRAKSSWTPFPKEDYCTRRRAFGELSRPAGM